MNAGCGDLLEGGDQLGDVIQLEEEIRRPAGILVQRRDNGFCGRDLSPFPTKLKLVHRPGLRSEPVNAVFGMLVRGFIPISPGSSYLVDIVYYQRFKFASLCHRIIGIFVPSIWENRMFDRFERAFSLGAACWKVLMLDKEMLIFPILSTAALVLIFGGALYPLWASGQVEVWMQALESNPDLLQHPLVLAVSFALYFIAAFVMIFFNAALLTCAMIRFAGGDPTVMDGLRASMHRMPQIVAWALVTATVGIVLDLLESRLRGLARFFINLLGAGWAVATYFAVPVLVVDGYGPLKAIRHSVAAVRKTWGESLIGHVGLGALNFIGILIAVPFLVVAAIRYQQDPVLAATVIALVVIWMMLCTLVITTLNAILRAGLYIYAVEGIMPVNFDSDLVTNAFEAK